MVAGALIDGVAALGDRLLTALPVVIVTVFLSWILLRLVRSLLRQAIRRVLERRGEPPREVAIRLHTLASVIESAIRLVVLLVGGMTVLSALGVPIAPLLASAGVAGLAIGLGAQSLIRDLVGGFFIVLEDQYHVGDVIRVNGPSGPSGLVEQLTLRYTALRGLDGSYTIVPNGDVRTVTNLTRDWARAVVDVDVALEEDLSRARTVLEEVLAEVERDPALADSLLEPGDILGVEALSTTHATLRLTIKTRPGEQWRVARALRARIKAAYDRAGIAIPYPRSVVRTEPNPDILQSTRVPAKPAETAKECGLEVNQPGGSSPKHPATDHASPHRTTPPPHS
jgi:small conductance mechanosensitive channel